MLRSLIGRRYRAGDRVVIALTAPGYLAERVEIIVRRSRLPRLRSLAS